MEATLAGLQNAILRDGPLMARLLPGPARRIARMVVSRWGSLTAGKRERAWAKARIKEDVVALYPFWTSFVLKMLVTLIVNWIMSNRSPLIDAKMQHIRKKEIL